MIDIIPFKAVRPPRDKAGLVGSRPFYNYKKHILNAKLEGNPYTFLHVINPEFKKGDKTKPNTVERFQKVRNKYEEFINEGILKKENKDKLYIYRQITPTNTFIGLIAGVSVQNYINGEIKIHEHTLTEREKTFCKYIEVCRFNAEPVLLTYKDNAIIDSLFEKYIQTRSEYEFSTTDCIKHDLWLVESEEDIRLFQQAFKEIPFVYIADGHHRSASSVLYAKDNPANPLAQYFLAFFIAESNLKIVEFNRTVNDLNGLSEEDFLNALKPFFKIIPHGNNAFSPNEQHNFSMYLNGSWYQLITRLEYIDETSLTGTLDTQILSDTIFEKILNIQDLKKDKRVSFIEGTQGLEKLKLMVDTNKAKVAFALYPVSIEQLKNIADTQSIMPPKSTWIEPKLRSGLTIFEF